MALKLDRQTTIAAIFVLVEGGDFKVAQVRLAVDFMRLEHVTVVENRQRNELDSLQANTQVHAE